jgi:hypothetical protein
VHFSFGKKMKNEKGKIQERFIALKNRLSKPSTAEKRLI